MDGRMLLIVCERGTESERKEQRTCIIDWVAIGMMDASFAAQLFISRLSFVTSIDAVQAYT